MFHSGRLFKVNPVGTVDISSGLSKPRKPIDARAETAVHERGKNARKQHIGLSTHDLPFLAVLHETGFLLSSD